MLYGFLKNGTHHWYSDRKQTTIWNFKKPKRNENHPRSKPLDLLSYPIQNSSQENAIVVDTFGGSSNLKIIVRIKWACKVPYLVNSAGISLINIIGYSAMAGVVGGGGIGSHAIIFGFQRFNWNIIAIDVVIIVIIVCLIQIINNLLVRFLLWRCLCIKH